jgi:valyl-tRNA synthetase
MVKALTDMRIANPIYDSVFKHLMEDPEIARGFMERVLGVEIIDMAQQPHEITERAAAGLGDSQAILRVYRIDFSATVRQSDGRMHKVLIELQKTSKGEAVARFRNYLSRHYAVPSNAQAALPIIAIYLLGFELSPTLPKVTRVRRQYLDAVSGAALAESQRVPFIEQLTHDAVVVQIPKIDDVTDTGLERLLQVFNQDYLDAVNPHYLRVPEDMDESTDPIFRRAVRTLLKAASDDETVRQMEVEDEIVGVLDDLDYAKLQTEEQRAQKEIERAQKEIEREQKEIERAQKEVERAQKEIERAEKEAALEKIRELESKIAALGGA